MQQSPPLTRAAAAGMLGALSVAAGLCTPLRAGTPANADTAPAAAAMRVDPPIHTNTATHADVATPDPLVAMFVWWNAAYRQRDGFTAEAFSRYFTADAVMRINGSDRSRGVADLAQHFRDIQARTERVAIELPFIDEFTSADGTQIFTHHFVVAREHGKNSRERVMGYATIKDGKISLINFVSVPDAAQH